MPVDYHGWTHRPKALGGTDPIEGLEQSNRPWILISGGATTCPTDTFMPIPFGMITYDPALVTQGEIFDWDITDTGDTGNDRYVISSVLEGWYEYELITGWDQVTSPGSNNLGAATQRITWNPGLNSPWSSNERRHSADWFSNNFEEGNFEMLDNPYVSGRGRVFVGPASGGGAQSPREWLLTAQQTTGVDRGLSGVRFWLEYTAPDDSAGWTFDFV